MLHKIKYYLKEILLFVLVMTIFANGLSLYKSSDISKEPFNLANATLVNEKKFINSPDKPTLVHIWAIWCPTCKLEASNIQSVSKDYNVLTIAVKSGSKLTIQKWLDENNYDFNVINDYRGSLSSKLNISVFPTTLIYDKNNKLVFSDVGYTSTWGLRLRMWWAGI